MKKLIVSLALLISFNLFSADPPRPDSGDTINAILSCMATGAAVLLGLYLLYRLILLICKASRRTWLSNLAPGQMVRYNKSDKWILSVDHSTETVELCGGIKATFNEIGRA